MPDGTGLDALPRPPRTGSSTSASPSSTPSPSPPASPAPGCKPVVAIYSTFLQRAYDQMIHDVCMQKLPVTFAIDRAGLVGDDGPTHHGVFDLAYLRTVPNMVVMAPKDENELRHMLKTAVALERSGRRPLPAGERARRALRRRAEDASHRRGGSAPGGRRRRPSRHRARWCTLPSGPPRPSRSAASRRASSTPASASRSTST